MVDSIILAYTAAASPSVLQSGNDNEVKIIEIEMEIRSPY